MINFFKNPKILIACILFLFVAIRVPGLDLLYHQDENKYAMSVSVADNNTPHPPLSKEIMVYTAKIFGRDNFRTTPLIFAIANLLLLYYFVRFKFGHRQALWSGILFTVVFYNILASLMVDIDGAILPFFFLLSLIFYFKWQDAQSYRSKISWGIFLGLSIILGFLTKLSFIIVACALTLDFLIERSRKVGKKELARYSLIASVMLILLVASLWAAKFLFSSFNLARTISHATDYLQISGRAYLQILIQSVKALIYVSPLLIAPLVFLKRADWRKLRFFTVFLVLGLIFYLVIFDFSRAALDKYLTFIIVPLCIMAGIGLNNVLGSIRSIGYSRLQKNIFLGLSAGLIFIVFALQFLPHFAPSLYPKEEWISRIIKLKWNFVFPFTGGSGPVGFYVSWFFISMIWLISIALAVMFFFKKKWLAPVAISILSLGILYNTVFAEEYLFGKINGNSNMLFKNAFTFIKNNSAIKKVITYNDIGGGQLAKIGKYERRLYAAPKFEESYKNILSKFSGHYLVIDIPHLSPDSPYAKHFATCRVIYEERHGKITSKIYDCQE